MVNFKLIGIAIILPISLVVAQEEYKLDKTYPVKKNALVTISTDDADIIINGSDRNDVHLKVYRKVELIGTGTETKFEIQVEEREGNLYIRENRSSGSSYWVGYKSTEYKIELEIPAEVKLVVSEDDGDIVLNNISGDLDIDCEDGDLELNQFSGKNLNIEMEDGDIKINNASGFLSLRSEDGDVEANSCSFNKIDLNTEDGDVNIQTSLSQNSQYKLSAEDGDIKFYISGSGAKIDLNAEDGNININGDFNSISKDENSRHLEFGDNSAIVTISTEDGDIKVSR